MWQIRHVLDWLTHLLMVISGLVFALMAVHIVADVAGRYLFRSPLPGTVEIVARYYMVLLVFLPLAYVQKREGHFVAGIFTDRLPPSVLLRLIGFTDLVMAAVGALLTWSAVSAAIHATQNAEQVQLAEFLLPAWPGRWLVPLGLGLMSIYALLNGVTKLFFPADVQVPRQSELI